MGHIYIVIYINIWVNFTTTEPCSPEPALVHHGLCEGDHPHWWPQDSGGLEHEFYDFPFSWEYETTNQYIHIYIFYLHVSCHQRDMLLRSGRHSHGRWSYFWRVDHHIFYGQGFQFVSHLQNTWCQSWMNQPWYYGLWIRGGTLQIVVIWYFLMVSLN